MNNPKIFSNYPLWMVFAVNILMLTVYAAGAYILFTLGLVTGMLYVLFLLLLEVQVYREGCVNCFYYGKRCAFGKGIIAAMLFKKGNPKKFCEREIKFKDLIPQALVILIPVIIGIVLLVSRGFNLFILAAMLYPVISWFAVNPVVYGRLACPHCKQGSICCPALKFFTKAKKKK